MGTIAITGAQIRRLRTEAEGAGDDKIVGLCDLAESGDTGATEALAAVLVSERRQREIDRDSERAIELATESIETMERFIRDAHRLILRAKTEGKIIGLANKVRHQLTWGMANAAGDLDLCQDAETNLLRNGFTSRLV